MGNANRCRGRGESTTEIAVLALNRLWFLLVVSHASIACGGRQDPPPLVPNGPSENKARTVSKKPRITLNVPDSVAGFVLIHKEDYEDPSVGYLLRYSGADSMYADVFVYPGPMLGTPCDTTVANDALSDQVTGFRDGFPTMIERHYVDSIAVTSDQMLVRGVDSPWCLGRHLTLAVIRDGQPQRSDFYLYALSGYFVKVRVTFPVTPTRLALEQRFTDALFSVLVSK